MKVGLLLPHFGDESAWDRLIRFAPTAERLGFDSFWVRDHLSYRPGQFDPPGHRFIDSFMTLAALSSITERATLGFGVAIPIRHPLMTLQLMGSLAWLAQGRVEMGLGIGAGAHQFDTLGIRYKDRSELADETAHIIKLARQTPGSLSFDGNLTRFSDVTIDPLPPADLPFWYGGYSPPALRRAVAYCSGIMPARTPFSKLEPAVGQLSSLAAERGVPMSIGSVPFISVGTNYAKAFSDVRDQIELLMGRSIEHPRDVRTDLAGAVVMGSPDDCLEQLEEFVERGIDTVVLDARLQFSKYEEMVHQVGEEVLPRLSTRSRQA